MAKTTDIKRGLWLPNSQSTEHGLEAEHNRIGSRCRVRDQSVVYSNEEVDSDGDSEGEYEPSVDSDGDT